MIGFPANIVSQQFNMTANPITGIVAGTVFGNNQISCGNILSTRWIVTQYKATNQPIGIPQYYCLTSPGTFNPATSQPCQTPPPAPGYIYLLSNPIQNQTWTQPLGTTGFFVGAFDFTGATVTGLSGGGGGGRGASCTGGICLVAPATQGIVVADGVDGNTTVAAATDINGALGYTAANDSNVVHPTGTETISGLKTFSNNASFNGDVNIFGNINLSAAGPLFIQGLQQIGTPVVTGGNAYGFFVKNNADDVGEKTSGCFEQLEQGLVDIQGQGSSGGVTLVKDFLGDVIREVELRSRKTGLTGLPTGIPDLDEATSGIQQGELVVIGATPGCGKTALGTQIALASANAGNRVAIFSLEMTQNELGTRLLANESTVSASRLRNPSFITKDQWIELARCSEYLCQLPIHVDASSTLTIYELVARARRFIRQHQCRLIVVDYIRLIKAPGKELREQVGNATDALRQLAKKEKVGVIALSQLARPVGKNSNTRPSMLRLKESGDIEAHAHIVLLIHMPTKAGKPTGEDEIIVAKNRHGPIGTIEVTFSRDRLKFLPRFVEDFEQGQLGEALMRRPKEDRPSAALA